MFPRRVKYMLTFFDIFGYNSGSSVLSNHRGIANFICFLHVLLALFFTLLTFYIKMRLTPHTRSVELLNNLLQYSSTIYMYWFTIWDSFYHWRAHHRFWSIFREINESFQSQRNFTYRTFILKVFSVVCATILSIFIVQLTAKTSVTMNDMIIINTILIKLCQIRIFYYLFCLEAINFQLKSIDNALKKLCERINCSTGDNDINYFKWMQKYYHCVYEMAYLSNDIFNWSQVGAVSFCFYALLTDLNWLSVNFNVLSTVHLIGK